LDSPKLPNFQAIGKLQPHHAIMAFKKAQRLARPSPIIESRNERIPPVEDATEFYQKIFQSIPQILEEKNEMKKKAKILTETESQPKFSFLSPSVSAKIFSYPRTKTCGADGIHCLVLRSLCGGSFLDDFCRFLNLCATTGATPSQWNEALVYPLAKHHAAKTIEDHRPISLTLMFRRIFEGLLLDVLYGDSFRDCIKLNFAQAGFCERKSTLLNIATLHDTHLQQGGFMIFIDLKQAYDRVDLELLLQKLVDRRLPPVIVSLIRSLFVGCSIRVSVNGSLTPSIRLLTGLLQGSLLSPLLFDVYIDSLADALNGTNPSSIPRCLLFADDLALKHGRNVAHHEIQQDLDTITQWCNSHNMLVGHKKCALISDCDMTESLVLQETPLQIAESYTYLGVEFSRKGMDVDRYLEKALGKAQRTLNSLSSMRSIWPECVKAAIYRTFCRPQLEYAAPLVLCANSIPTRPKSAVDLQEPYKKLHQSAMEFIFDHSRITNTDSSLAGIPNPEFRLQQLLTSFAHHIERSPPDHPTHIRYSQPLLPAESLIGRCQHNADLKRYKKYVEDCARQQRRASPLPVWLKNNTIVHLVAAYGKLASLVPPSSRTPSGMDRTLLIPDRQTRRLAIAWRRNALHYLFRCPVCDDRFHRGHLECEPFGYEVDDRKNDSTVDTMLNRGNWDGFVGLMKKLAPPK
jgi:hypothetical protein